MTDSRARSDEQAIEAVPDAGGAWATNAHIASQVSSASAAPDTARRDRTVYRVRALLIVVGIVGITLTILLYLLVYAFAGGFAPTTAVQCRRRPPCGRQAARSRRRCDNERGRHRS